MSRGGGNKDKNVGMCGVSTEEVERIDKIVKSREDDWTFDCLKNMFNNLVEVLGYKEKVKKTDTISTLATKTVSMVSTVCGLYKYQVKQEEYVDKVLSAVVSERGAKEKSHMARLEINTLRIVCNALEKQLEKERNK